MTFSSKFISLTLGIVLVITIATSSFVYTSNIKTLETQIKNKLENEAFHTMEKISQMLFERYTNILVMATDSILTSRSSTPKEITARLIKYRNLYKAYISLSFFDLNRKRIADTSGLHLGKQHELTPWARDTIDKGVVSVASDIRYAKDVKRDVIYFASPVKDEAGVPFGVVVARMPIDKLNYITGKASGIHVEDKIVKIDLINAEGLLLFSNYNKKGILKDNLSKFDAIKDAIKQKNGSVIHNCMISKGQCIFTFMHDHGSLDLKAKGWTILLHVPTKVALSPAIELRNKMIMFGVPLVLLSILVILFFSRKITGPIVMLRDAATEIGKGKLETRIIIDSKDEIGQLSTSFNKMAENLEEMTQKITVSNDYINNIIKSMTDTLIVVKPDGTIETVNRAALNLLDYTEEELINRPIATVFADEEGLFRKTGIVDMAKKSFVTNMEMTCLSKNGRKIPVLFSGSVMRDADDNIQGIVCVVSDITEHKQFDYERQQMEIKMIATSKLASLGEIATGVAHEINQPLTYISSFIQNLKIDLKAGMIDKNELLSKLTISHKQINRINDIIQHLRTFGRRDNMVMRQVNIETVLENTLLIMGERIRLKNIKMIKNIQQNLPVITGNLNQLEQVFINLFQNAIHAFEKDVKYAEIRVVMLSAETKDSIVIIITDNGTGIAEKDLSKIFEPFFTTKEVGQGTGLGLSIVYGIINEHNGTISCESEVEKGTTFTITLPV